MVKAGYKQTEVGLIPQDWVITQLRNVLNENPQYGINAPSVTFQGNLPVYIRITDISKDGYFLPETIVAVDHASSSQYYLKEGDLVFARTGASVGKSYLYNPLDGKLVFAGFLIRIRPNKNKLLPNYLAQYVKTNAYWNWVQVMSMRSGQPGINSNEYGQLLLPLPPKEEQRAIAAALSDVDALIAGLDKLIAKKRDVKTAVMQQLLTGEKRLMRGNGRGYKQTELGQIPKDWDIIRLKNVLQKKPQYGINAPSVAYQGNLPVYIRITDISEEGYFTPETVVSVNHPDSDQYYLEEGDLVFARTGASVGKSYKYNPLDGKLVFAGFLIKIRPDTNKLLPSYLAQYVKTNAYWNWVQVMSMRSGQPGINGNEYGQLLMPLPRIDEQRAIAKILSDMDTEITALQTHCAKTQAIKQGMMQELLTGRTRLVPPRSSGTIK